MAFEFGLEAFLAAPDLSGTVGLVSNATGVDRHGVHVAQRLAGHPRLRLHRLFSPEHGFWSAAPDGEPVDHARHPTLGVPIVSLYGDRQVPAAEDLAGLDHLVYDIQDVGVRFYTYISTLRNVIDATAGTGPPLHVLDRPDPVGGLVVEGPDLTAGFESFVGHLAVPLRYGLTPGELARWYNSRLARKADLVVWPCREYRRGEPFPALGVPWVKPSPSMTSAATAAFYPGTCLIEGTNVAEGRGTEAPFQIIGAPWIDPAPLLKALQPLLPDGVRARPALFRPTFAKFAGETCHGVHLETDRPILENAVGVGIRLLEALLLTHGDRFEFPSRPGRPFPFFDLLAGNSWLREGLLAGIAAADLEQRARAEAEAFTAARQAFFLYP